MVLDNEKIQIRVEPGRAPGLGAKQDHLLRVNLPDNDRDHFLKEFFDFRTHAQQVEIFAKEFKIFSLSLNYKTFTSFVP